MALSVRRRWYYAPSWNIVKMFITSKLEIPNKAPSCIVRITGSLGEDTEPVFLGSVDNVTVTVGR